MRITTQGVYGLVCVLRIAREAKNTPVSIQTISKKEQLSIDYIEQLLLKLRRAGIVKSVRGRAGGYVLAKSASKITIKDIIECVEGSVFETICFNTVNIKNKCVEPRGCLVKPVWLELKKRIEGYLKSVTIDNLLNSNGKKYNKIGVH